MESDSRLNGADLIIRLLERQGVRIVAGIPGGALLPLYEALGRSTVIRHILARHEQAAGFIAQGMARLNGKAGVCFATSGPGVTNMVTALADAKLDSVPLVCIAGQVPTGLIGTDAFQEVPTTDIVRPITKAALFVRSADELAHVIPEAFRIAQSGRPGPVLVDVPKDVQAQFVSAACPLPALPRGAGEGETRSGLATMDESCSPLVHRAASVFEAMDESCSSLPRGAGEGQGGGERLRCRYEEASRLIDAADRPVLYIGGGTVKARAQSLVREVAELARIPVTTTLMALGTLPADHPLNLGMLGMHGARHTNLVIDECDLLVAIGARFDDRATGNPARFAPNAKIIHIDIDTREFGKIKQPTLSINDDARSALSELLQRIARTARPAWLARAVQLRAQYPLHTPHEHELCSPYGIVRAVSDLAPPDCIVTTDVGQHQMWVAQRFAFSRAERWLTSGGLGTMGFGLPAAIGAALAEPSGTAICFTGDGSLLMNVQELATLAELDLNVKIVLFDNAALGLVRQQQELFYRRRFVASLYAQPSSFVAIAKAFGVPAIDLEMEAAPHGALANALSSDGPVLVRVPIAAEHHVLPMVAPGKANVEALDYTSAAQTARAELEGEACK